MKTAIFSFGWQHPISGIKRHNCNFILNYIFWSYTYFGMFYSSQPSSSLYVFFNYSMATRLISTTAATIHLLLILREFKFTQLLFYVPSPLRGLVIIMPILTFDTPALNSSIKLHLYYYLKLFSQEMCLLSLFLLLCTFPYIIFWSSLYSSVSSYQMAQILQFSYFNGSVLLVRYFINAAYFQGSPICQHFKCFQASHMHFFDAYASIPYKAPKT